MGETDRIIFNRCKDYYPDGLYIIYQSSSCDCFEKVKEVCLVISDFNKLSWIDYSVWRQQLPRWILESFEENNIEDVIQNPEKYLWDFESWIDALKDRQWRWWSNRITENGVFEIIVEPLDHPMVIEPLEYIIRESGVNNFVYLEKKKDTIIKQQIWKKSGNRWSIT